MPLWTKALAHSLSLTASSPIRGVVDVEPITETPGKRWEHTGKTRREPAQNPCVDRNLSSGGIQDHATLDKNI